MGNVIDYLLYFIKKIHSFDIGVDLNRNYAYKFGADNLGSSPLVCDEDYRGASGIWKSFYWKNPLVKI